MTNVVDIVIRGKDLSSPSVKSATANMKTLGDQSRQMGRAFSEVGQIANTLGNKSLAGLAIQSAGLISIGESLLSTFRKVSLLRATVMGAVIAAAGLGISKYMEWKDAAERTAEANQEITKSIQEMEVQNLKLAESDSANFAEAELRHKRRLEQIKELMDAGADLEQVEKAINESKAILQKETNAAILTDYQKFRREMQELDRLYNEGNVAGYINALNDTNGALLADMEGKREMLAAYRDFWLESHRTMFSYVAEGSRIVGQSLSNSLVNVITGAQNASEAFKELGLSIARMFATWAINRAIAFAAEKILSAVGLGLAKAQAAAVSVVAASTAAAWAPAATASLIATFGASASAASLLTPLMVANQVAATGLSLAGAGGVAHGGLDYVPRESTYLLNEGERVLAPRQNEELMDFVRSGGGGPMQLVIDGRVLGEVVNGLGRDGRLTIPARAVRS